ncbi:MAG: phage major capsid protein [Acidobacteria bacterium]|nr:phage major capsid protein [Acidobacteriota bacterium]
MPPLEEQITELNRLVGEVRTRFEQTEKGAFTKADFKEFETKTSARIAALETVISRPPMQTQTAEPGDGKAKEGEAEYKTALFQYMRTGEFKLTDAKAVKYVQEQKALVADATGQILISADIEATIERALPQLNIMRPLCSARPTTKDRVLLRSISETIVGWGILELGDVAPESTLVPTEAYQYVEGQIGLTKIGEDELADSDYALEPILSDSFNIKLADSEEAGILNGLGHVVRQMAGILPAASLVPTVAATAADAVTTDDVLRLIYACPSQYRARGSFVFHSQTELLLRLLRATTFDATHFGAYIWQPSVQAGRPATLHGYPCYCADSMPQVTDGALQRFIIFGDFKSGYRLLDRSGMTIQRLIENYSLAGQIGFRVKRRVGGAVIRPAALRIMIEP